MVRDPSESGFGGPFDMDQSQNMVPLQDYLAVLRRHRLLVLAITVIAALLALGLSVVRTPTYTAKSTLAFNDESQDLAALGTPASPNFQPDKLAAAQSETVKRPDVVRRVRAQLHLRDSVTKLQDSVATAVEPASNLVGITVQWKDGKLAASIANAFARQTHDVIQNSVRSRDRAAAAALQKRANKLTKPEDLGTRAAYLERVSRLQALAAFARPVDVVQQARVPASPSSPRPVRDTVLAALLGLMFGIGAAFLRHALDRRIRDVETIRQRMQYPVMGYLHDSALGFAVPEGDGVKGFSEDDLEASRIVRTNVGVLDPEQPLKTVLVTSPLPGEGKSTAAASLAYVEAVAGRTTLLVDCDMRRSSLAGRFGVPSEPGLADYLKGQASPADILRTVALRGAGSLNGAGPSPGNLVVIPAGSPVTNAAELLGTERFRDFLRDVAQVYDRVILDTPPLLPVGDTLELLPVIDGVLLCLRVGQTTREQALAAKEALSHFPAKPTGLVMTGVVPGTGADYAGYYSYSHSYGPAVAR
jgi:capsular exopolysaccharide synthesis family protein